MTIPSGTPVHVCGLEGMRWGTVEGTWYAATGAVYAYNVAFQTCPGQGDGSGMAWIVAPLVTDVSALGDRDRAAFSAVGGRA